MYYVYVLQSISDEQLYIGFTNDLRRRFSKHQSKKSRSTKSRAPFELIYYEAYADWHDAHDREQNLKLRGNARRQLLVRIARCRKSKEK